MYTKTGISSYRATQYTRSRGAPGPPFFRNKSLTVSTVQKRPNQISFQSRPPRGGWRGRVGSPNLISQYAAYHPVCCVRSYDAGTLLTCAAGAVGAFIFAPELRLHTLLPVTILLCLILMRCRAPAFRDHDSGVHREAKNQKSARE